MTDVTDPHLQAPAAQSDPVRSWCLSCGRERRGNEFQCPPPCAGSIYGPSLPGDLCGRPEVGAELGGVLGGLLELPAGWTGLIFGPRGSGKSSIGLTAICGTPEIPAGDVVTTEMSPPTVNTYAARLRVRALNVTAPRWTDSGLDLGLRDGAISILLDSATATGHAVAVVDALRGWCADHGARVLFICHTTKQGIIAGPERIAHDVDVVVRVDIEGKQRRITVEKNRGGPTASAVFELDKDGVHLPHWRGYYSIEGTAPSYRVVSFPAPRRGRYSVMLQAAKKGKKGGAPKLPAPPLAVSSLDGGELYKGRWVEPSDGAERCAFALAHGLAYRSADGQVHRPKPVSSTGTDVPTDVDELDQDDETDPS